MMERAIDLTHEPEEGGFYLVPCVFAERVTGGHPEWVPVLGPKHEDAELLNFPHVHYHVDWRFMSARAIVRWTGADLHRIARHGMGLAALQGYVVTNWKEGPVERPRRCAGKMLPHPDHERTQRQLEPRYAGCRINPQKPVCPHRGVPLNGLPEDEAMCVTCPAHGLRWSMLTGELAPRLPAAGAGAETTGGAA